MYRVAVIIPVFNQWGYTSSCLKSLREHTPWENVQVLVVDNGSTDKTPALCAQVGNEIFGSRFEYIRLEENINFGPACNLGARTADAQFLFFLNNDTECTPGWLEPLLNAFNDKTGAVGPLLLYPESNLVQHLGISFTPTDNLIHLYHCIPAVSTLAQKGRKVQALTAAALMIRRDLFTFVGGFCEEYKNGYEDIDLCASLGREGYTLKCVPESRIYHYTSMSEGRFDHDSENCGVFMRRAASLVRADTHLHAAQDGLDIAFNELLQVYYRLGEDKSRELEKWSSDAAFKEIFRMLVKYPYWEQGYELALKRAGKEVSVAFDILHSQALYFPLKRVYARLAKTARACGELQEAEACLKELQKMDEYFLSEPYMQRLKCIRKWAQLDNDAGLMKVYRELRG
ncbi:MAG: glycosyltransferase family 2 protein [Desulfonatronovibrionaceae bacterium]